MSEMVERVARAMCAARGIDPDRRPKRIDSISFGGAGKTKTSLGPAEWETKAIEARAAIAEMREPTEAMIEAGRQEDNWCQVEGQEPQPDIWRAMIDAAQSGS
jgi:hypothetical protein